MKLGQILDDFKNSLLGEKNFFKKLKKEKSIYKGFSYFTVLTVIVLIITGYRYLESLNELLFNIYKITGLEELAVQIDITPSIYISFIVITTILSISLAFLRYYLVHISLLLFKKNLAYKDTYNSLCYSVTPGYIGMASLGLAFLSFIFTLNWLGWFFTSIWLFFELYSIYIRSRGIALTHGVSWFKGFLTIYILSTLLMLILLIPIYIILLVILI